MIAGEGHDEARVRREVKRLGLDDRVRFVGWVRGEEKARLLAEARAVAMPSRMETFGIVAVEGFAAATPVVAFAIPSLREVVPEGAGFAVEPFDVEAYAQRLLQVCTDAELALAMGVGGPQVRGGVRLGRPRRPAGRDVPDGGGRGDGPRPASGAACRGVPGESVRRHGAVVTVSHRSVPEGIARVLHDGRPAVFVSPHLDDAVLSCAALMRAMVSRAPVTVVTLFSAAGPPPHTRAARTFLRQCGADDAAALFDGRCREDVEVLDGLGVRYVHLGHPDALFRRRRDPSGLLRRAGRVLPELDHRYPTFRFDIDLGRVSRGDRALLDLSPAEVADIARGAAVFAPARGRAARRPPARPPGGGAPGCGAVRGLPVHRPRSRGRGRGGRRHAPVGVDATTCPPSGRRSPATGRRSTRCSRTGRSRCGRRRTTRRGPDRHY